MQYLIGSVVSSFFGMMIYNPMKWDNPGIMVVPILIVGFAAMVHDMNGEK